MIETRGNGPLLCPKRFHRVHARYAARRQIAGHRSCSEQANSNDRICQRIDRADLEQQSGPRAPVAPVVPDGETTGWFDPQREGGFIRRSANSYLAEPGDPWVLVSISSQLQDDIPLAETALAALALKPVRVILTVGPDHMPDELSIHPANAYIEQTVPHSAALKRGVLLVSHAGHGSVMKALWEGRPMVLTPWGRDQPGVAARAHALGVAEIVPRSPDAEAALAEAIDRALASSEMQRAAAAHSARLLPQMTGTKE